MQKKNKNAIILMALLTLVAVTAMYVASTYAKYTTKIEGNEGTATVAKWDFENDNKTQTVEIKLKETVNASTLVANKIAPGTSGSFNIALVNTNSEVGVDFVVALKSISDKPTNLKFYKDEAHTTEITPGTTEIKGQLIAKDSTGVNVPIYWEWAYETDAIATNDPKDTADGIAAKTLTIGVDITGTQVQPSATAITSHVD